jgi:hypothetical protein
MAILVRDRHLPSAVYPDAVYIYRNIRVCALLFGNILYFNLVM